MPRLPTAQDLGQRPTPSVKGGIAPLDLKTPRMGQEAQALVQFGNSLQGLGDTMAQLAIKEKRELDAARSEDAFNEYSDGLIKFEYGDPEGQEVGFANILTGDAVKNNITKIYRDKRDALRKAIREKLANDTQKSAFDQRADIADRQFDGRKYAHVATQSRQYQGVVSEGVRATERRMAALNWSQPGQIELSILRTNVEVERKAKLDGLDPEREGDRQVIDTLKAIAETQIHADVVDAMILGGKDTAASAYYNAIRDRLTPEAIITLGAKVQASSTDGEAIRAADQVWEIAGPQGLNDPTRLDIMEGLIRDKYSDNPTVMKAAIQDLRSRAVAHNDGQQEQRATDRAKVLEAFHDGASLKDLQQMPEYWQLDGDARMELRDYITNSGWTEQQRARAEAEYLEGSKSRNGFQAYWELSNPKVLSGMSEAQILSLEPTLGRTLTSDLMEQRRKLDSPAKIREATIDTDLFNQLASDAGLSPYKKSLGAHEKEQLGRLRNQVKSVIDVAQQMKGGPLSREEKEKVMRSEIERKVMIDEWGKDPSLPAAIVKPEQREKVYVPLNDIDPSWIKGAINYMRSTGQIPVDWTDEKAKQAMKGRIERAYGHSITGGSSVEGRAILEGK